MTKLLTVFGATGAQGGSLAKHVLQHPVLSKQYSVRGITRDPSKVTAVELQKLGAELVKADMDDAASLFDAVKGSYAVFSVTNFWEKISVASEVAQGKAIADASVAAGASLLIWCSLPGAPSYPAGKSAPPHFQSKADVETYIRDLPIRSAFFMAGFYMQNHLQIFAPRKTADGWALVHAWAPDVKLPLVDIEDTGKYVAPILLDEEKFEGKRLYGATRYYTPLEIVDGWTKGSGVKVEYKQATTNEELFGNMPKDMAEHMPNAVAEWKDMTYYGDEGKEGVKWTRQEVEKTGERLTEWQEFVAREKGAWFKE